MTKEKILQAKTSHDIFVLIKEHRELVDKEVMELYDKLRLDEFRINCPDADVIYDILPKKDDS
ncbi:MAG: hypothetical protein RSA20_10590 [Oscillospiraceae bacterium]